jgi:hypothetical protein
MGRQRTYKRELDEDPGVLGRHLSYLRHMFFLCLMFLSLRPSRMRELWEYSMSLSVHNDRPTFRKHTAA